MTRKETRDKNQCVDCPNPSNGKRYCPHCAEIHYRAVKKWAAKKVREEGVCPGCLKRPPEPGRKRCRECLDRAAAAMKELYHRRIKKGKCALCNKKKARNHSRFCEFHAAYMARKQKELRDRRRKKAG